ncbi:hypothetical protein HCJ93_17710 [Streptomyces sp. SBST2-5]|uniref:ABC transporter permease n=1 Tax=Streptomyces composti TaxID=2720025 RepID=A0ABX1A6B9_9ACTN|nr:hypothetical protein [Streptomyces composti]NJP51850.1 hypothetical protein [Streptomyces composti]
MRRTQRPPRAPAIPGRRRTHAPATPERRPPRAPAALREMRAELPLLVCTTLLIALLSAVAAGAPALLDRFAGEALTARLDQAQRSAPGLRLSARFEPATRRGPRDLATGLGEGLHAATTVIGNAVPGPLKGRLAPYATRVELASVGIRTAGRETALGLIHASDAPGRAVYAEGRPPDPRSRTIEVAFSTRTRDTLKLRLGQRLPLRPGSLEPAGATAVVVGFFTADERGSGPGARLWREQPLLARPSQQPPRDGSGPRWEARALVAPRTLTTLQDRTGVTLTADWSLRLDLDVAAAARFAGEEGRKELRRLLTRYPDDARTAYCGDIGSFGGMYCRIGDHAASSLDDRTPLLDSLDTFGRQWRHGRVVISFALASLLAVGVLTVVATALLALRRRLDVHRLQRARGASAHRLALTRAAHTAPAALAGLAAGLTAARSLPPAAPADHYGAGVAVLVWLLLPALTWYALRDRTARTRQDAPGPRRGGRRIVAELLVLLLAAAGVAALRTRGTAGAGPDPLLAAVPALLGLAVVAVLLRCYPLPVRLAARWAARGRGAVALIALSRAAKEAPARALALLVLVVTLAGAVSGGIVVGTLADARRTAAAWQAGADAAYLGAAHHPGVAERLARARGVESTVRVRQLRVDPTSATSGERHGVGSLLAVDGDRLRAASPDSEAGRALAAARIGSTAPSGGDIPVLASDARTGEALTIVSHGRKLRLRVVGRLPAEVLRDPALGPVRSSTTARDRMLLTDNRALTAIDPGDYEQTALLLYGPRLDVRELRAVVPEAASAAALGELRIRAEEEAEASSDGLIRVLVTAHTGCTALAVALALPALLLDLLLSAPARVRTAAHLRTLGLNCGATSALHLLQLLPMVLAALVGGGALGLMLPVLLEPALRLDEFTGGPGTPGTAPDPLLAAAAGAGLGLLVLTAVGMETWWGGRRRLGAVLRLTEER